MRTSTATGARRCRSATAALGSKTLRSLEVKFSDAPFHICLRLLLPTSPSLCATSGLLSVRQLTSQSTPANSSWCDQAIRRQTSMRFWWIDSERATGVLSFISGHDTEFVTAAPLPDILGIVDRSWWRRRRSETSGEPRGAFIDHLNKCDAMHCRVLDCT